MEHIPESIEAIMARMGERYFAIPAADLVGAAQPTSPEASSARTNGTPPQASHETTTVPSPLFPGALADYIPAEVFLENMGFFTPSSKKIRGLYLKEKKVAEKTDQDGTKRVIKVEISANHRLGLPITSDLDYYRAFLKIFHTPPNYVVECGIAHRKPPDVRIWRLSNQSRVGTLPPSTSTPHCPACWARRW
jgi:hypothetical protein